LMTHDVFYTAYYCSAKVTASVPGNGNLTEERLIEVFKEGLEAQMLDADETSQALALLLDSSNESTSLACDMSSLSPFDSNTYIQFANITKIQTGVLGPGQERKFVTGSKKTKKVNRQELDNRDIYKGYTKWILIRYHGSMGHDTTNTDDAGTMASRLAFFEKKLHQMKIAKGEFPLLAVANTRPSVTALEGPSEFSDVPDDE
jgi:hypothetical protein